MFNLSDNELDRLSREAADAYEVEKNASSWEALEKRLDIELGAAPSPPGQEAPAPHGIYYPLVYTTMVITIIATGYFLFKSSKKNNITITKNFTLKDNKNDISKANTGEGNTTGKKAETITGNSIAKDNLPAQNNTSIEKEKLTEKQKTGMDNTAFDPIEKTEKGKQDETGKSGTGDAIAPLGRSNNPLEEKPYSTNARIKNKKNFSNINSTNHTSPEANGLTSGIAPGKSPKKNNLKKNADRRNKLTDNKTLNNSNNDIIENISPENSNPQGIAESRLSYAHSGLAPLAINRSAIIISDSSLLAEAGKISRQPTGKRSLNTNRPLEIGIVFGPDYSKVKYAYTDTKLGSSVGLAIGYHLLSRLSVNTAIIYTHKYYEVDGHHFHPGPGAARPNGDIEFVKGSFKMFEVPLNFRYDFSFEDNTSFFIGAGSSSYLMQGEDYNYFCHYNLAASAWVNQPAADPRKNFWFSTFNLSGGFETYLSKNISFQLEPYIKLPLRKIGLGNVSLSSYGINLAIKFSPALKKSRH